MTPKISQNTGRSRKREISSTVQKISLRPSTMAVLKSNTKSIKTEQEEETKSKSQTTIGKRRTSNRISGQHERSISPSMRLTRVKSERNLAELSELDESGEDCENNENKKNENHNNKKEGKNGSEDKNVTPLRRSTRAKLAN